MDEGSLLMLPALDLERAPTGPGGLFYGVYPAIVEELGTGQHQGYVKVRLPWSPDSGSAAYAVWARLAVLMAGADRGTWFIPDPEDEVLVAFQGGRAEHPYVIGGLWNGQDAPPEQMDGNQDNNLKTICSRQGIRITLDDTQGAVKLTLETPGGHTVTLDDGGLKVMIEDSNGNSIKLDPGGITVQASALVKVQASMVQVDAALSKFSGVVQCDTLITNSVISASYTPGAGNIW
jgi:uncharacterized protein involved in type VI secretion and phage assembly